MNKLQELKDFIKTNCIKRGDFTLKSGLKSNYYINLDQLWDYKDRHITPSFTLADFADNIDIYKTVFVAEGGACGLCRKLTRNTRQALLIEKRNGGEVIYPPDWSTCITKACIVEDVATTGNTILELIQLVPKYIKDITVLIFVDRSDRYNSLDKIREQAKVITLFKIEELLENN